MDDRITIGMRRRHMHDTNGFTIEVERRRIVKRDYR